jgi:hypothetical protein
VLSFSLDHATRAETDATEDGGPMREAD